MTYSLKLERMIDATPEEVFDAFTDANAQKEWWQRGVARGRPASPDGSG